MGWDEFLADRPRKRKRSHGNYTYADFEYDYRRMYGIYFDHDWLLQIRLHGHEQAGLVIKARVDRLNASVRRRMEAERLAGEREKTAHAFHAPDASEAAEIPF